MFSGTSTGRGRKDNPEICWMNDAARLHAAWIALSRLNRVGTKHSGFNCIQSDATNNQSDDDQRDNAGLFRLHLIGVMVKFSQAAHPYLPVFPPTAGSFVPNLRFVIQLLMSRAGPGAPRIYHQTNGAA